MIMLRKKLAMVMVMGMGMGMVVLGREMAQGQVRARQVTVVTHN